MAAHVLGVTVQAVTNLANDDRLVIAEKRPTGNRHYQLFFRRADVERLRDELNGTSVKGLPPSYEHERLIEDARLSYEHERFIEDARLSIDDRAGNTEITLTRLVANVLATMDAERHLYRSRLKRLSRSEGRLRELESLRGQIKRIRDALGNGGLA